MTTNAHTEAAFVAYVETHGVPTVDGLGDVRPSHVVAIYDLAQRFRTSEEYRAAKTADRAEKAEAAKEKSAAIEAKRLARAAALRAKADAIEAGELKPGRPRKATLEEVGKALETPTDVEHLSHNGEVEVFENEGGHVDLLGALEDSLKVAPIEDDEETVVILDDDEAEDGFILEDEDDF